MKGIVHAVIPAVLLAVSAGQIYAFTNFSSDIAAAIGASQEAVQFAFSLGIFFLGMGAAFFGRIVEKNIGLATAVGTSLFVSGMFATGAAVVLKSLWLLYVGYGVLLGAGTGIIYIAPVKTMMLWYPRRNAVAAAVPIISFGLGSTLSTIVYKGACGFGGLYDAFRVGYGGNGVAYAFASLAVIYAMVMSAAGKMLKKPETAEAMTGVSGDGDAVFSYRKLAGDWFFIRAWAFMFLNISAGLSLIPLASQMMRSSSASYEETVVTLVLVICGVSNGAGRLVFAAWSDLMPDRKAILPVISAISAAFVLGCIVDMAFVGIALVAVNACYGAGFSVIPGILAQKYGMRNLSKIHGAVLSAWGVAGLVGNQAALLVEREFGGYHAVFTMLLLAYFANLVNGASMAGGGFRRTFTTWQTLRKGN